MQSIKPGAAGTRPMPMERDQRRGNTDTTETGTLAEQQQQQQQRQQRQMPSAFFVDSNGRKVFRVACKARGVGDDHNPITAYLEIPEDAPHGYQLACSHRVCAVSKRLFRYCAICRRPVAKRNFNLRHGHAELQLLNPPPVMTTSTTTTTRTAPSAPAVTVAVSSTADQTQLVPSSAMLCQPISASESYEKEKKHRHQSGRLREEEGERTGTDDRVRSAKRLRLLPSASFGHSQESNARRRGSIMQLLSVASSLSSSAGSARKDRKQSVKQSSSSESDEQQEGQKKRTSNKKSSSRDNGGDHMQRKPRGKQEGINSRRQRGEYDVTSSLSSGNKPSDDDDDDRQPKERNLDDGNGSQTKCRSSKKSNHGRRSRMYHHSGAPMSIVTLSSTSIPSTGPPMEQYNDYCSDKKMSQEEVQWLTLFRNRPADNADLTTMCQWLTTIVQTCTSLVPPYNQHILKVVRDRQQQRRQVAVGSPEGATSAASGSAAGSCPTDDIMTVLLKRLLTNVKDRDSESDSSSLSHLTEALQDAQEGEADGGQPDESIFESTGSSEASS